MNWSVGAGLEGQTVVITGATGGIGQAVTHAFAATGARILATDLDQHRLDTLLLEIPGEGHLAMAMDLTSFESQESLMERAVSELGGVHVLVHTAALLLRRSNLDDVTEDDWDAQIDTNLKTTFFLCRRAANEMKKVGRGSIVLFTSQSWWTGGFGGAAVYAASKGGVVSLSRGLARSYGQYGITVNAVAPGQINTPMLLNDLDPAIYEKMREETPLGYVGEPDDVSGVVIFLASKHARYITGATINVSGGYLMY